MEAGSIDLVFGTGYNSIAAVTTKGVVYDAQTREENITAK